MTELVVVGAIVAVLAALAAPSFGDMIRNQRVKAATGDLVAALVYARNEAVKRNAGVTIGRIGTSWSSGWTVSYQDGGTQTPRAHPALTQLNVTATVSSVTFGGGGRADTSANFTIDSDPQSPGVTVRCVEIGVDGTPRSWNERGGNHSCADD